ncbi:unnamed protein product [Protopolystoma xenopodis]|uniref:Uncharacterized protein n=1 Tax=Protopolystoma xenopodis TaxID=117903 RepID=A0A448XBC5_9PLAT|nr:unnamed protein product [Protopolystoma xenopodis]
MHNMNELLFETYNVRKVSYYVDSAASYFYNSRNFFDCDSNSILVSLGYRACHMIAMKPNPFLFSGRTSAIRPIFSASRRLNLGGFHITCFLQQLLQLKYGCHLENITLGLAEHLLHNCCRVASSYQDEINFMSSSFNSSNPRHVLVRLPFVKF